MRCAVIGIGSNSTRLLVGDIQDGTVRTVLRDRAGTRLFAGLMADGSLCAQSMLRAADAAARFAADARQAGSERLRIIATSASRDAKNGAELQEMIEALCGAPMEILSGPQEAYYSFLGATGEGYCGLVDVGGGSTELACGGDGRPLKTASVQLGALRLLGEAPDLSGDGFARAVATAVGRVRAEWARMDVRDMPAAWYGVGGTLTCLAAVDMALAAFDHEAVNGHRLTRQAVAGWARRLADMPPEARAQLPGMLPRRADIIAHGAVALYGAMEALRLPWISVSNRTNLDGCLREMAETRAGEPASPC